MGPNPGVSASTEPPVRSTTTASLTHTSLPPEQSHSEQAKPTSKHKSKKSKEAKKREGDSQSLNTAPTPAPTGPNTSGTTVHILSETDFALLLPSRQGGV